MEEARELDRAHPATLRSEFVVPTWRSMGLPGDDPDREVVYLCGNSLGLMPKRTRAAVGGELDAWAARGVEGHFRHPGQGAGFEPWVNVDLPLLPPLAALVGAQEDEVAVLGSCTANLNSLLVAFYRPRGARTKILVERGTFPSDHYALANQCRLHGLDPAEHLLLIEPREGELHVRADDVERMIADNSDTLAVVCLSGVQYYTGQAFEIERLTRFAHQFPDIVVGWDLAHAIGNVELALHDWGVDFACWCSYKYLNAGPGAIGGLFVHARHGGRSGEPPLPRLAGWWGNNAQERFRMLEKFDPIPGALGFRQSNPSAIDVAALRASLELYAEFGGMKRLRARSLLLTGYLVRLLRASRHFRGSVGSDVGFTLVTPVDRDCDHGAQVSILFFPAAEHQDPDQSVMKQVSQYVSARGLIVDERRPDAMRITPAPLYNTFSDVFEAVHLLDEALDQVKLVA